ncbi:VanZ family protein [Pelosinus sp. sgz500959]|uniref:VanZ family protein n=1 Tax=Pelosinus sp. sgz500959 TaxID=3242472 RepID=UPI00366CC12D
MNKKLWRWLLVTGLIMIIYALSNIPNLHIIPESTIPLWFKKLIGRYTIKFGTTGYFSYTISLHPDYILHKIGHIIAFGTLGVAIYWAMSYSVIWAITLNAVLATLDEWHQSFVPGRSGRFGDVILDTLAAIVFIGIMKYLNQRKRSID